MSEPAGDRFRAGTLEELVPLIVWGSSVAAVMLAVQALVPGLFGPGRALWVLALIPAHVLFVGLTLARRTATPFQVLVMNTYGIAVGLVLAVLAVNQLVLLLSVISVVLVPLSTAMTQSRAAVHLMVGASSAGVAGLALLLEGSWAWRMPAALLLAGMCAAPGMTVLDYRTRLEEARREAEALATSDPLTGLANRRGLAEKAPLLIARAARDGRALAVLVADLDHFKRTNDGYGHKVGDEVLCQVAAVVAGTVRLTDVAARIGGEEFCVLAVMERAEDLDVLAERLRAAVEDALVSWGTTVSVGGVTLAPEALYGVDASSTELVWSMIDRADGLMYEAKSAGRNAVRVLAA
ncbi:diguanylate cyclase [Spongisporangium articulatum]|uniref:Diguanylate cyclase n=1 Tax=Spongisporangium articulatum TaxID=3362603 RepID=A0ABW8AQW9_9ACTN